MPWQVGVWGWFSLLRSLQPIDQESPYLVTAANTMAQHAAVEALTAGKNDAEPMKKEYIQRRDYIIEKMTDLGLRLLTRWGFLYLC